MIQLLLTSSVVATGKYLIDHLNKKASEYKLLFIYTAAEGEVGGINSKWLDLDRQGLSKSGFKIKDFTISGKTELELKQAFSDIVFVNGGNTFYLLDQVRKTGFDKILKEFLDKGGIYGGSSAGSILSGPNIEATKKIESKLYDLKSTKGLGLVNFVVMPHWGSDIFKDLYLNQRLSQAYTSKYPLLFIGDLQYIIVEDNNLRIINKFKPDVQV